MNFTPNRLASAVKPLSKLAAKHTGKLQLVSKTYLKSRSKKKRSGSSHWNPWNFGSINEGPRKELMLSET